MRIISGKFKKTHISAPKNLRTRPLQNNIQEALFNIIEDVGDVSVLDLFSGFGMFSWEALSRGAEHCTLVEKDRKTVAFLNRTASGLGVRDSVDIINRDVFKGLVLEENSFDLIFADPPFYMDLGEPVKKLVRESCWLKEKGVFIIRTFKDECLDSDEESLLFRRKYGESIGSIYRFI